MPLTATPAARFAVSPLFPQWNGGVAGAGERVVLCKEADLRAARALAGGLASAAMFAYIAGSSFVVIELYGVSP